MIITWAATVISGGCISMIKEHFYNTMCVDTFKDNERLSPSQGVNFKIKTPEPGSTLNEKDKFFFDALAWFDSYEPDRSVMFIKFKLQGTRFNIRNQKDVIIRWFRRLQKLKQSHFKNYSFAKFLTDKKVKAGNSCNIK